MLLRACACAVTAATVLAMAAASDAACQTAAPRFSFREQLGASASIALHPPQVTGGRVSVNGADSRRSRQPFTFDWGDGTHTRSFFPAQHTYADPTRPYVVTVTAQYPDGTRSKQSVRVAFGPPDTSFTRDPTVARRIRVPSEPIVLRTSVPAMRPPTNLQSFSDGELAVPRAALEYVLDVGHHVQMDFANGDVDTSGGLDQVVLKQLSFGGAFSLWFTRPVAMGANPSFLASLNGVSGLFHEMGHNITLNSPARYRFGGKTDGPMNTTVSETLAQIFAHSAAWEILNHPGHYGLGPGLVAGLEASARMAMGGAANAYHHYVSSGCPFTTRQVRGVKYDPSIGTFMSLNYVFIEQAEREGRYREPLKRMMRLLQTFCPADHTRYQRPEEEAFRATFMVAAMSYGFDRDLRPRFRALKFAIDDDVYAEMMDRMRLAR